MPAVWTFLAVALLGVGIRELVIGPRRRLEAMLSRVGHLEVDLPLRQRLMTWATAQVLRRLPLLTGAGSMEELRQLILWAGRPWGLGAEEFYFLQVVCGAGLAVLLFSVDPLWAVGGFIVGLLGPRWWLRQRVSMIAGSVRRELPQFVHLMATALEAGMGLTEAVRRIAHESPGILAGEMQRTILEIATGKPAQRAWTDLMARTTCQELKEIVTAIMQSQEYGVGIAEQLRFTMRAIRQRKQQHAQQKAQEASVRMRVPMVVCILIPTMLIVLGPAAISLARVFGG